MNKVYSIITFALVASATLFGSTSVLAQDEKQAELERNFYNECYTKRDKNACLPLARELGEKYPTSQYAKFAQQQIKGDLSEKFQGALSAFYAAPDAPKLEQLIQSSESYLTMETGQTAVTYVTARVALANALFAQERGARLTLRIDDLNPERSRPAFAEAISVKTTGRSSMRRIVACSAMVVKGATTVGRSSATGATIVFSVPMSIWASRTTSRMVFPSS